MENVLNQHYNFRKLIRYTLPMIVMMLATSIYTIVDGLFIANTVGDTAFSGVNFAFPVIYALGIIGFVFGTGGSALISKKYGEGKIEEGNRIFTMLVFLLAALGVLLSIAAYFLIGPILSALGGEGQMGAYAFEYGKTLSFFLPFVMTMYAMQSFMVVAGKPGLGFLFSLCAGLTNVLGDAVFIYALDWGVFGAALASGFSQVIGAVLPIFYLFFSKKTPLRFTKLSFDLKAIWKTVTNGISEMVSNLSYSVVGIILNAELLKYFGENGVSAYGIIGYLGFVFTGVYYGYASGVAPIISYHYGAKNEKEVQSLLSKSLILYTVLSLTMASAAIASARILSSFFSKDNDALLSLATSAVRIYSISYYLSGFGLFGSSFFTALNDGLVSGILSFLKAFVFPIVCIYVTPLLMGPEGIWWSIVFAEVSSFLATGAFLFAKNKKYHYFKTKKVTPAESSED